MQRLGISVLRITIIVFLVVMAPCVILAQQTGKIGTFSMEEVLSTSDVGKAANDEFKKLFEKNKKTIQDREKELYKIKDELDKQRPILTEQALKDKEMAYQKKFRDYQDMVKDANEELNNRRQELVSKYVPDIMKIVGSIGEKDKYALIIDLSTMPVAYSMKENNITARIIEEFNKITKKK